MFIDENSHVVANPLHGWVTTRSQNGEERRFCKTSCHRADIFESEHPGQSYKKHVTDSSKTCHFFRWPSLSALRCAQTPKGESS